MTELINTTAPTSSNLDQPNSRHLDHDVCLLRDIVLVGFVEGGARLSELDQFAVLAKRLARESGDDIAPDHWRYEYEQAARAIAKLLASVKTLATYAYQTNATVAESGDSHRALVAHLMHKRESFLNWFTTRQLDVERELPRIYSGDEAFPELQDQGAFHEPVDEDATNVRSNSSQTEGEVVP